MSAEMFLNCAETPLEKGVHLIEASAGTGKTYAIGMLVLRCVTELNIPIDAILVVTFTKAATEELKSRIRSRLAQARDLLETPGQADATMQAWLATVSDRKVYAKRLQLALLDIDRAGIFTIHSFCQRMLTEQALESDQLFDVELLADTSHINSEVTRDFWRKHLYGLSPTPCAVITGTFTTPEELYLSVRGATGKYDVLVPDCISISEAVSAFEQWYGSMSAWWAAESENLFTYFNTAHQEGKFKKPLTDEFGSWWQSMDCFFTTEGMPLPGHFHFLTADGLQQTINARKVPKARQAEYLKDWPLPADAENLIGAAGDLVLAFRHNLIHVVSEQVEQRLLTLGHMSFDDLITRLDRALNDGGDELQRVVSDRFRVGLIDEFQDTDSAQWRIFSRLFTPEEHYLYLIGDPKQAIYRFRGADIYSYFAAREAADHHLTLPNNYRSHPELVEEVNRLFSSREDPFAFNRPDMVFHPVVPAKNEEDGAICIGAEKLAVMNYCQLEPYAQDKAGRWTSGKAAASFLRFVVREVCTLLDGENLAVIRRTVDGEEVEVPLAARDIAVLVRSNSQADLYLQGFAEAGVPAIVASKKGVFETPECQELYTLLQALVVPGDSYRLKSAMTVSWFAMSGNELMQIWEDERLFDDWFNRFLSYSQLWQEQGFLVMMNSLLEMERVYIKLAENSMAERRIANIHHLLELIQEAETTEKFGPEQTLQWVHSMLAGEPGAEDRELRLESDEQAVRIVTMHSAKGLQYPVVFCPYLWYRSSRLKQEKNLVSCHDANQRLVVDIGSDLFEEHRKRAMAEELAEDLRLLYVALTRAELRCYTMWVNTRASGSVDASLGSALGSLLYSDGQTGFAEQRDVLQAISLRAGVEHTYVADHERDTEPIPVYTPHHPDAIVLQPLESTGRSLQTEYQMSSYSALAALSEHEDHGTDLSPEAEDEGERILHPGMAAGASFGNLVHDSLELFDFASLAQKTDHSIEIDRLCTRYGISMEIEAIQELLATIVTTSLCLDQAGKPGFSLAELNPRHCLAEMPFYFHLSRLETEKLNEILADEPTVVPLSHKTMRGYLTGFVDLFCEHEGKFYILDYKTNYLGDRLEDYRQENLVQAMAAHNYGLQYWIYTLVLHKHLQNMLEEYQYETHFGGVMYLFVRGMVPDRPGSGVFTTLPSAELLEKLEKTVGGGI